MKYRLSIHAQDVVESRNIKVEWINLVIEEPSAKISVDINEIHFFKSIVEHSDRCLKVVVNPIKQLIITAYFDRAMRKRGCK